MSERRKAFLGFKSAWTHKSQGNVWYENLTFLIKKRPQSSYMHNFYYIQGNGSKNIMLNMHSQKLPTHPNHK